MDEYSKHVLPVAQLWQGTQISEQVIAYLQSVYCPQGPCAETICRQIHKKTYHLVTWLVPTKVTYTLQDTDIIRQRMTNALDEGQRYFFIITSAELLSVVCANSLLKSLEEPPRGYHFILLTNRPGMVLPTVASRCVRFIKQGQSDVLEHPLLQLLKQPTKASLAAFGRVYDDALTGTDTATLLDILLDFWGEQARTAHGNVTQYYTALQMMGVLQAAYQQLPMPGSSKLFWRNLILKMIILFESAPRL